MKHVSARQVTRSVPPDDEIWGLPSNPAPNGYTWTINYVSYDGDVPDPGEENGLYFNSSADAVSCPPLTRWQRYVSTLVVHAICSGPSSTSIALESRPTNSIHCAVYASGMTGWSVH